jgi:hypothetical protein
MTTIRQLRYAKYKVRVLHDRKFQSIKKLGGVYEEINPRGGFTKIEITIPDESMMAIGISICSDADCYDRKVGNQIALGRALKELNDRGHYPQLT